MTRTLVRATLLLAVTCSVACGGGLITHVPADAQAALRPDVAALRTAIAAGDRASAEQALAALRQHVTQLHDARALPAANEREILTTADAVAAQLGAVAPVTTSPPTTEAPPDTTPGPGKDHGKGDGGNGD